MPKPVKLALAILLLLVVILVVLWANSLWPFGGTETKAASQAPQFTPEQQQELKKEQEKVQQQQGKRLPSGA
jgi:hypothetical protein